MNKIKVGNTFLESTSLIAQTLQVNNLGSIETRQGGASNNFSFPFSSTNRQALGFPEDLNNSTRNPYIKVSASLYDGNVYLRSGYLKITEVTNTDIKATFFSDNSGWFNEIKEKTLKDLNLQSLNHGWTGANIRASLSNTTGYIYPLIDYGLFGSATLANDIATTNLYPAVYVSNIFSQIFTDINYEIDGELFDLFEYNQSVIPFSAEDFVNSEDFITNNTLTEDYLDQTVFNGDIIELDPSGTSFNPSANSLYSITFNVDVTNFTGTAFVQFNTVVNGVGSSLFGTFSSNGTYQFTTTENLLSTDNFGIQLNAVSGSFTSLDISNASVTITPTEELVEGNTIEIDRILPEIKQSDFVKYVCNVFGVIAIADPVINKVTFNLFKNIKGRINDAVDWSNKIDISSSRNVNFTELLSDYGSISLFDYIDDDKDFEIQTYKARNGINFGSGEFVINNEHISDKKQVYEAPFASTINIVSFSNEIYIPQIRWFNSDGSKEETPKPKICLIVTGFTVDELTGGVYSTVSIDGTTVSNLPFAWFVKAPYTTNTDVYTQSLSFGDIFFTENVEGTLAQYWTEYQALLNNIKYLTANFSLNAADIAILDFSKPVYLDKFKSYFYINSVNEYTGSEQLTEVELIRIPTE